MRSFSSFSSDGVKFVSVHAEAFLRQEDFLSVKSEENEGMKNHKLMSLQEKENHSMCGKLS